MPADIALVIVTYNSAHVILDLLDSIPGAVDGMDVQIVIVDNGSTDGTPDVVREHGGCLLVESTNDGYSAGINRGVRHAGPVHSIVVLNPDVRLLPGSVHSLVEELREPRVGIAVPMVRSEDGTLQHSLRREPTLLRALGLTSTRLAALSEYVHEPRAYERPSDIDWALGAVMAVSAECHRSLGGWDESFFLYSEETDLCLRARDRGFLVRYVPSACAVHIGAQSGQSDAIHAMQIINRVRLYHRRHGAVVSSAYLALTVLSEATWIVRGHRQSRFAVRALLRPSLRPPELHASQGLLPT